MNLSWQLATQKSDLLAKIRSFLAQRAVVEVDVPVLSQGTITDLHLEAFEVDFKYSATAEQAKLYLQTSPEFAMKRLLAAGFQDIYYLGKAFRHEAARRHHNPEFLMLEWYRLGFDDHQLMAEVDELLQRILDTTKASNISYQDVFIQYTGIDPLACTRQDLIILLEQNNKLSDWLLAESLDTLLQFCFAEIIEPKIGLTTPCFIYNFPASQASLARIDEQDSRVARRFECYYQGIELANGFYELTDANVQLARFEQDNQLRENADLPLKPIDDRFIKALEQGLPECSGVALGVDRLLMLALKQSHIKNVLTFDISNA